MDKPTLNYYTDGGCRGNGRENNIGGLGVVVLDDSGVLIHSFNWRCEDRTTNNRMELQAMIMALDHAIDNNIHIGYRLNFYSDATYVVEGINRWLPNWQARRFRDVKNKELWKALLERLVTLKAANADATFFWVRGHSNVPGNELADRLANDAMDGELRGDQEVPDIRAGCTLSAEMQALIRDYLARRPDASLADFAQSTGMSISEVSAATPSPCAPGMGS